MQLEQLELTGGGTLTLYLRESVEAMPHFRQRPLVLVVPGGGYTHVEWMLDTLLSGGLLLGAFFMATDYATSPVTKKGQLIFGIGCGLFTVFIRYFGSYNEGVCYSIMVMNCCTALIDKYTKPVRFGVVKSDKKEAAAK